MIIVIIITIIIIILAIIVTIGVIIYLLVFLFILIEQIHLLVDFHLGSKGNQKEPEVHFGGPSGFWHIAKWERSDCGLLPGYFI